MCREIFLNVSALFTRDSKKVMDAWSEIEHQYAEKHRFYHNLHHISQLVDELKPFGTRFQDPAATWFAVFYHDIIYYPLQDSNEEKSAE